MTPGPAPTSVGPLDGLAVALPADGPSASWARWCVAGLGGRPVSAPSAPRLEHRLGGTAADAGAGLPAATLDYCCGMALATAALAGLLGGRRVDVSETGVAVQLRLPEVMAASYGSSRTMRPGGPRPAPGGGWYHADLGAPGDAELFETLVGTLGDRWSARRLAETAQEWRLPVCDYRHPGSPGPPNGPGHSSGPALGPDGTVTTATTTDTGAVPPRRGLPLEGVVVIDLTAIWAGPLATWLLSGLGAEVQKVEPAVRPDGFRAMDGDGIHPGGAPRDPGRDSGMWNALNHGKARLDLNLGVEDQRQEMVERVRSAHLWIDSLSPRVLPNWGFDQVLRTSPGLVAVSMPAFPVGPMRNWVAYGTGVHAVSGLGSTGPGRPEEPFWSPAVSYPDPVAGLRAALVATAGLLARSRGVATPPSEATLLGSVLPLLGAGPAGAAGPGGPSRESGAGPLFLAAAASAGILADRSVAGSDLAHPLSPLLPRT